MNKQQKVQELAEKLMDGLDDADLNDAILLFPKCRAAGEDQDNAVEHLVDEIVKGQNGKNGRGQAQGNGDAYINGKE